MSRWLAVAAALAACAPREVDPGAQGPRPLVDLDPDPMVFEADLHAAPARWSTGAHEVDGLAYEGQVPGPLIRVPLGARVRVHFHNDLPEGMDTTIHWHGIEGNNAADGTHTTQAPVAPGASFTYDFVVTRPGLFWYHPHVRGAKGVFEGLYGTLIVDDPDEPALRDQGVLPEAEQVLLLSDVSLLGDRPWSVEVDNAMEVMNGTEGELLLVNGQERPTIEVPGAVRLRLVNTSITRFWRLSVPGHALLRVGGEGGLLDHARVEGGPIAATRYPTPDAPEPVEIDPGFRRGEIVLGPAERADVVLIATGSPGDRLELRWEDFARGRHGMWMEGDEMVMEDAPDDGLRPGVVVADLLITDADPGAPTLTEGAPVLAALGRAVGRLPDNADVAWVGADAMVLSERMDMVLDDAGVWQMTTDLYVDGATWRHAHQDPTHTGPHAPEAPTARHARLGQMLLWELRNESAMAHPVHLHGFSYQPLFFEHHDEAGVPTRWELGYDEMEDTTLLPGHTSLFIRMHLEDRVGDGGALGRWMRHCHIMQHGEAGMMSEFIVGP